MDFGAYTPLPMPKIYVAQRTDTPGPGVDGEGNENGNGPATVNKPIASGSMTTMKERLRVFPDTSWTIKTVQIKTDVPSICALVEDWSTLPPESTEAVRVNTAGQVRAAK